MSPGLGLTSREGGASAFPEPSILTAPPSLEEGGFDRRGGGDREVELCAQGCQFTRGGAKIPPQAIALQSSTFAVVAVAVTGS